MEKNNISSFAAGLVIACGFIGLSVVVLDDIGAPSNSESFVYPNTKFGSYLAIKHAIWADDFDSVIKFSEDLKDSDIASVKADAAIGRFLAGSFDDSAKVLAGEKTLLARSAYIAYLLQRDDWKSIHKLVAKDTSQLLAPLRVWSAVAVGKESEALAFIDSLNGHAGRKMFMRGMVYAETNRIEKAKAAFDQVPLDFFNINDYAYLTAFYRKHGFDEAAQELCADFSATPGGAFTIGCVAAESDFFGVKKALGFGLIQNVSHAPAMIYSSASLVLLRLAQAADSSENDAANYYLGTFFYHMDSPNYSMHFKKIGADSPYSLFVMLKNAEKAGNFSKIRAGLKAALKKNPLFMPALQKLVAINLQKSRENDALKAVNNALEQKGLSDKIQSHLLLLRARVYVQKGDLDRAENDILKAGDLAPENPDILTAAAKIWAEKRENLDKAYLYASAVIKDSPSDIDGWDAIAMVVLAKEGAAEAAEVLERVGRVASENSSLFRHLGDVRAELGDKKGAAEAYERALSLSSDGLSCEKCIKKKIRRLK
jgi:tetratricopeptide (TPR) repeat protein